MHTMKVTMTLTTAFVVMSVALYCQIDVTSSATTTPANGACIENGILYANGEMMNEAADKCYGTECRDGWPMAWDNDCRNTPDCFGVEEKLPNQCCPICHVTCNIGGTTYSEGEKTNSDACSPCECGSNGRERCSTVSCTNDTNCDEPIQKPGDCCFTCGTSGVHSTMVTAWGVVCAMFYMYWQR